METHCSCAACQSAVKQRKRTWVLNNWITIWVVWIWFFLGLWKWSVNPFIVQSNFECLTVLLFFLIVNTSAVTGRPARFPPPMVRVWSPTNRWSSVSNGHRLFFKLPIFKIPTFRTASEYFGFLVFFLQPADYILHLANFTSTVEGFVLSGNYIKPPAQSSKATMRLLRKTYIQKCLKVWFSVTRLCIPQRPEIPAPKLHL